MDNVNVLNQMAEYDFSSPIDVTMIFEDSDDDASFENVLRERKNIKNDNNNKEVPFEEYETESLKNYKSSENLNSRKDINRSISLNKNSKIHKNITKLIEIRNKITGKMGNNDKNVELTKNTNDANRHHNHNKSVSNKHSLIIRNEIREVAENNEDCVPIIHHEINDNEPITIFVEDLLKKLSEHLILIIKSFYHYGVRKNVCDPLAAQDSHNREKVFHFIKSHFFELSFTTMKSIILPREKNYKFINQFLDNTVLMANSKSVKWKCQKRLVLIFFNDLVRWTKQKQAYYIKTLKTNLQHPSNENMNLKEQLIRPLQPFNLSHSKSTSNSNYAPTLNTQNNLCIFSSGTPGNEISININPDTLINCTQGQYTNTAEWTGNQKKHASSGECAARNTSLASPPYEHHVNDIQRNNNKYYRQPPPYSMNPRSINFITKSNQNNRNIFYRIQNRHNIRQPDKNHQNTGQPFQNHLTQVKYTNINEASLPDSDYLNSLLLNNTNNQMHVSQMEKQITSKPVISNVTSLNPKACMNITIRCCLCGKMIETTCFQQCNQPCRSSNQPRRPSYCSYLCQELDGQIHNVTCGDT